MSLTETAQDYTEPDVVQFLKEEFERIITRFPLQREGSVLSEAQAFEIWFLRQEMGIEYEQAYPKILDGNNDCGVDFIWIDDNNKQVVVGQAEYEPSWSGDPASVAKATGTFKKFYEYLSTSRLPDDLADHAKDSWRLAKQKSAEYGIRYVYITPKRFTAKQEERIKTSNGLLNYDLITHDILVERGEEFLDGQTGMCNFDLKCESILKIPFDSGTVYTANVKVGEISGIVNSHKERKRLRALFASNVRTYLTTKKRNKEIAEAMKLTLKKAPQEFLLCNNGITIISNKVDHNDNILSLHRASITNGCQTAMNIHQFFQEYPGSNPAAQVLVTAIEIPKEITRLAGDIARSRNNQNPVDYRDLMSNNFRLVCLHHRLLADKVAGSERRYYLIRKAGEKQTLLKEEPESRGKYIWIDAAVLAQCIAAVIRQDPYTSQAGISDLFGKSFNRIFPDVGDPTHSRCKYSWWLSQVIWWTYDTNTRWKDIKDIQVSYEKDFKNPAHWVVAALVARKLVDDFRFNESLEQRFVAKAEKWWVRSSSPDSEEFFDSASEVMDDAFRLVYAVSRTLLGKKLPKADSPYTNYEDLLKGPSIYPVLNSTLKRGKMTTYQDRMFGSMKSLVEYLRNN